MHVQIAEITYTTLTSTTPCGSLKSCKQWENYLKLTLRQTKGLPCMPTLTRAPWMYPRRRKDSTSVPVGIRHHRYCIRCFRSLLPHAGVVVQRKVLCYMFGRVPSSNLLEREPMSSLKKSLTLQSNLPHKFLNTTPFPKRRYFKFLRNGHDQCGSLKGPL